MSVSSFFSSIADKAQTAIQSTPLSPSSSARGSHTLVAINYQLRSLKQQYGSVNPIQKIVTSSKGVAIDFDTVSRKTKASSKELYLWGQTEAEDIKDVTDRLAFFNFVSGSLASTLAKRLDDARTPMKTLRNAENTLAARLNIRAAYEREISKLETDRPRGHEKRLAEVEQLLRKAEIEDDPLEREVEILSRKALRESEQTKWDAIREYGEKLALLAQASSLVIEALPTIPPNTNDRYGGAQKTAAVRAGLQRALDNYKTGHLDLPISDAETEINRSDTRSFGETHASELSSIRTPTPSGSPSLRYEETPASPGEKAHATKPASASPVIDPQQLNQAPSPLPVLSSNVEDTKQSYLDLNIPTSTPTIAETGVPQSAGPEGPGPTSGSLKDVRSTITPSKTGHQYGSVSLGSTCSDVYESAEEEKKRLEQEDRQRLLLRTGSTPAPRENPFESAEEEESMTHGVVGHPQDPDRHRLDGDGEELPPYNEI